jgi:hypothetical protein
LGDFLKKIAPKSFGRYFKEKNAPKGGRKMLPNRNFVQSGTDVMITIVCVFRQIFGKKIGVLSKTNVMITIFANTSSRLSKKTPKFSLKFKNS